MTTVFWVGFTAIVTAIGVGGTLYFAQIRPAIQQHKKHEAERDNKRRETDAFLYGVKPIDGVQEETLSAPRRLRALELSVGAVVQSSKKVSEAMGVVEQRMDEANGTGKRTEGKVDALSDLVKTIISTAADAKLVSANGHEQVVALTSESQAALLDAVHPEEKT